MILATHTQLGELFHVETYIDWNGPRLFSCMDTDDRLYLVMWIDTVNGTRRWWYVPTSHRILDEMRKGNRQPAQIVLEPAFGLFLVVTSEVGDVAQPIAVSDADPDDLPIPGDYIRCIGSLESSIREAQRRRIATSRSEEVLDLRLTGESVDDHSIGFEVLSIFLRRWFGFLKEQARAFNEVLDAEVYGFAPGSFVVRTTSGAASLNFAATAMRTIAQGDDAAIRRDIKTPAARSALGLLLDGLSDANLGLNTALSNARGFSSTSSLSLERVNQLRDAYKNRLPSRRNVTIDGLLDSASMAARQFTLITKEEVAIKVDVPSDLSTTLRGLVLGKRYEFEVIRHSLVNTFGDEGDVAYELFAAPPTPASGVLVSEGKAAERVKPVTGLSSVVPIYHPDNVAARWAKKLSLTDAQQSTAGVGHLRLTQSGNRIGSPGSWFGEGLFGSHLTWTRRRWGPVSKDIAEVADLECVVVLPGRPPLRRVLMVSHDSKRYIWDNYPATWLHWGKDLREQLASAKTYGRWVTIERDRDGIVWVQFPPNKPEWHGKPQPK